MTKEDELLIADFLRAPYNNYKEAARAMRQKIIKETYNMNKASAQKTMNELHELIFKARELSDKAAARSIIENLERAISSLYCYCLIAEKDYLLESSK